VRSKNKYGLHLVANTSSSAMAKRPFKHALFQALSQNDNIALLSNAMFSFWGTFRVT